MDFNQFARFSRDFGIFPDIMPKSRLLKLFNTLALINSTTTVTTGRLTDAATGAIDEHLFVEAVTLAANEIPYTSRLYQPNYVEKVWTGRHTDRQASRQKDNATLSFIPNIIYA